MTQYLYSYYTNSPKTNIISVWKTHSSAFFWATMFWIAVAKQMQYSIFHSCQYGGIRKNKTMLAFNHEAFHAVSAKCKGQNIKRKHAAWGLDKEKKGGKL